MRSFLGIGTRFSDRVICDIHSFAPNAKIVHIDIDPAEINKNITADYALIGDVKQVLEALCKKTSKAKSQYLDESDCRLEN